MSTKIEEGSSSATPKRDPYCAPEEIVTMLTHQGHVFLATKHRVYHIDGNTLYPISFEESPHPLYQPSIIDPAQP